MKSKVVHGFGWGFRLSAAKTVLLLPAVIYEDAGRMAPRHSPKLMRG